MIENIPEKKNYGIGQKKNKNKKETVSRVDFSDQRRFASILAGLSRSENISTRVSANINLL